MSKNNRPTVETIVICKDCDNKKRIWRIRGRTHPAGHIKHTYCDKCKNVTEHIDMNTEWYELVGGVSNA